ncbi:hypothetical protein NHX12_014519 [Muraenolepis orangiensis]|uniref:DUF6729 domain-containing protein n=1 Tax=Muraenolepis orangiensis TaxID=630683 RepID=A0A9Q0I271_9TELE|nr:hypothetical protein NHX12_014519 [Muraenolepis orangiensis]
MVLFDLNHFDSTLLFSIVTVCVTVMDDDEELERVMLSITPSKLQVHSFPPPALSKPAPCTTAELRDSPVDGLSTSAACAPDDGTVPPARKVLTVEDFGNVPSAQPVVPVPLPRDHDVTNWSCSQHQKLWMRTELQDLGLWPGSRPVRNPRKAISLWRLPPQPQLLDTGAELPSPNFFQLHPFFIWKPESDIMVRLRNNCILPCLHGCPHPNVVSAGVGRPRVIVGTGGQYYILSSQLCCKACQRNWFADSPRWLEKLPKRWTNLLPAFLTYKKAICKSVIDELRRMGKSPSDIANQRTIGHFVRKENTPRAFGPCGKKDAWCGVSVSSVYLTDCLLHEFRRQEPAMSKLLQGTRPVPMDWDNHRMQKRGEPAAPVPLSAVQTSAPVLAPDTAPSSTWTPLSAMASPVPAPAVGHPFSAVALKMQEMPSEDDQEASAAMEISHALPLLASPRIAHTGPIKTGFFGRRVFVLDHTRWTPLMKEAIDGLLQKYHGEKDMLRHVGRDYADLVNRSAIYPNSVLHPTTRLHISRYVKHMANLLNTSSSLNISQDKLQETQQMWQSLTESETARVPVVIMEPAVFNPPAPALSTTLTEDSIIKIVDCILEKQLQQQLQQLQQQQLQLQPPQQQRQQLQLQQQQLQQQQQQLKKKQTRKCVACGQPKSRFQTDGSSIHYFFQQGPVRYFYCSKKVHQLYAAEGLSNPQMPFEEFSDTEFFHRELKATKKRLEEAAEKKDKKAPKKPGYLCTFCHMELRKGPNSPHTHFNFPGVAGKYVYCPTKVYSLYRDKGMAKEMNWGEFQESPFFEIEKQRWVGEKK